MHIVDSIKNLIAMYAIVEPATILLYLFLILYAIAFPIARNILKKKGKSLKIWVICSFLPLAVCFVHFLFHIYDGALEITFKIFLKTYLISVLFPLFALFKNKKVLYHITACVLSTVIIVGTIAFSVGFTDTRIGIRNFSHQSYTQAYLSTIECLKELYVNSDWKEIDYDAINAEVYPMVEKAEQENDAVEFYIAMNRLVYLIPDGHVDVSAYNDEIYTEAEARLEGNDYGFIMFTLADGKTEAFDVDEDSEAYQNGIKSGTVITSWDNVPIDEAIANTRIDNYMTNFPVAENEEFLKALFLAGKGGDTVTVGFIDEDGNEKTAVLSKCGGYNDRLGLAITNVLYLYFDWENIFADNFSVRMLNDEVGCLKITDEMFDDFLEFKANLTGDFPEMTEFLTEKINSLKNQGMKKLIIDLRNNAGGNLDISLAVTSLFTDSTRIVNYDGGTRKMAAKVPNHLYGTGTFKDLPVVVLTNLDCVSAGDDMTKYLGQCDNVKVVGMTYSNNSSQPVGGCCMLPNGIMFKFPANIALDENGDVEIDTKADRIARVPLDEKIPVDEELARGIFETEEDAELNYVLEHYMD